MARTVDVGQWVQEDSIGYNAGDTNLYRYVGNNPTNQTDPSGLVVSPTGRPICKYELERPAPPDEYSVYAEGRFRGTYVGRWKFSNATYEWKGARFRSDVQIFAAAERRFKSDVAFQDDRVLTNFATFVRVEYSFVNVFRIDGKDEIKVPNFNEGYWLPVRLIGVFIEPTITKFTSSFKPTSFATFEREFIDGLNRLPMGHPSDKPK